MGINEYIHQRKKLQCKTKQPSRSLKPLHDQLGELLSEKADIRQKMEVHRMERIMLPPTEQPFIF